MTLDEAIARPNCISAIPTAEGAVVVTFSVHGSEGTRSYVFEGVPQEQLVRLGIGVSWRIANALL